MLPIFWQQRYPPLTSYSSQPHTVAVAFGVGGLAPVVYRVRARLIKLADSAGFTRGLRQMLEICILLASR